MLAALQGVAVAARAVVAHLAVPALAPVVAGRAHRVPLPQRARLRAVPRAPLAVPGARPVVVVLAVRVARRPVVAAPVVERAVRRLNRRWFSAAMARTTP
jgi:hypothetical protein